MFNLNPNSLLEKAKKWPSYHDGGYIIMSILHGESESVSHSVLSNAL